uniref:Granulin a n=1 Tax=Cyprinus carpio carpio TaxID=630221 RepID=A0A9J7XC85_CYPCA
MLKVTLGLALVTLVACSQCPNDEVCEAGQTCCQDPTGEFSCCPFHHGECCEDHLHCCPEGMLCSVVDSTCINATQTLPFVERIPAKRTDLPKSFRMIPSLPASEDDITCPDGSFCPAEFSCLLMASSYGCCPVAQGLVCSDGKHCCPKDHECSADSSLCVKLKEPVETVLCGNGTSECPVGTTCCETEDGQWACCPMPKAVCCDDKIHCCPEGSVCDVVGSKCMSTNQELPMWAKFPARLRAEWEDHKPAEMRSEAELTTTRQNTTAGIQMTTLAGALPESMCKFVHASDVPCNDTVACPDGNTCCKTKGEWGCCPLPQAVCCDDFIHCCPHGSTCNVATGSCDESSGSKPWFEKLPVKPISSQNVTTQNNTILFVLKLVCCFLKEDGAAAVCCDDFIHCCPHGTTCNVAAGSCDESSGSTPWLEKVPALPRAGQRSPGNVNCDSSHVCPDSNTCCKNIDGDWSCCPLPEAVCCTDGAHCCPANYKCDVTKVSCIKGDVVIPWYNKISAQSTPAPSLDLGAVECDEQSSCPADSTCCYLSTGEWGCCPHPEAVCCPDQQHCCPKGYRCDLRRRSCIKTTWLHVEIVPLAHIGGQTLQSSVSEKDIQCGGGYSCKDSETCCPTSQTTWGCCPSPKAECCDDMKHCCPAGYKCGEGGVCTSALGFNWNSWNNWRVFFSKKKRASTL